MNAYIRQKGLYNALVKSGGRLYRWNVTLGLLPHSTVIGIGAFPVLDLSQRPDLQREIDQAAKHLRVDHD
jgi:hypothetical protein